MKTATASGPANPIAALPREAGAEAENMIARNEDHCLPALAADRPNPAVRHAGAR